MSATSPGPWKWDDRGELRSEPTGFLVLGDGLAGNEEDKALIASAPDLLEALKAVNKLISEAAMTGFNWRDGDWAERLFFSQQATSAAIKKAETS